MRTVAYKKKKRRFKNLSIISMFIIVLVQLQLLGAVSLVTASTDAPGRSYLTIKDEVRNGSESIQVTVINNRIDEVVGDYVYEVYWISKGDPKHGISKASGEVKSLALNETDILTYDPEGELEPGEYAFVVYHRDEVPGIGREWSKKFSVGLAETLDPQLSITLVNEGCEVATFTVQNAENAGVFEGAEYKVYYSIDDDPSQGDVIYSGNVGSLQPGETFTLDFTPEKTGNYAVKVGEVWSNVVDVDLSDCGNQPPEDPDPLLTITLEKEDCEGIIGTVINDQVAGDLKEPVQYQIYFSKDSDPSTGEVVFSGNTEAIPSGGSYTFTFEPEESGNYIAKIGDKWSNLITYDLSGCENPPPEEPDPELLISLDNEGCSDIGVTVENGKDAGLFEGQVEYKVFFSVDGDPENGTVVEKGNIPSIGAGKSYSFTIVPKQSGHYIVLIGDEWSNAVSVDLSGCGGPDPDDPDLFFDSITSNGCEEGIEAVLKNSAGAGIMEGSYKYEVYYLGSVVPTLTSSEDNVMEVVASGDLEPIPPGDSAELVYKPTETGLYIFRVYESSGNVEFFEIFSDLVHFDNEDCSDPTNPTDPVDPTEPTNPQDPVDPIEPEKPGTLPKTGETNPILFYTSGLLMAALGMVLMGISRFRSSYRV